MKVDKHPIPAIHARVSHRDFTGEPIPPEMLEEILLAGTKAPTGGNMQPWEFVVVESQQTKNQIAKTTFSGYFSSRHELPALDRGCWRHYCHMCQSEENWCQIWATRL